MERNRLNTIISRNLLLIRQERRYSQNDIATVLTIKQPSYNRMESGRTHISADQLALLAEFYRLPVSVFFEPCKTLSKKLRAFSLTEVLVVLVIIGIITLLALPKDRKSTRLNSSH